MFNLTSNQVIKIHKGDDSGLFSLFINQGTKLEPIQYKFYAGVSINSKPDTLIVDINKDKFNSKISIDGFYDFEYNYLYNEQGQRISELGWYFLSTKVNIEDYGITYIGTPKEADHIVVARFKDHPSEVYFYIVDVNKDLDQWLIKKTFYTNGRTLTEYNQQCCCYKPVEDNYTTVNKDHDIVLKLGSEDTKYLETGEYCYQIRAKLYDMDNDNYQLNTVTNRLPLYIIDGEDSMVW